MTNYMQGFPALQGVGQVPNFGNPEQLAQALQMLKGGQNTLTNAVTVGNPQAQAQQQESLAAMMEAYKRAQGDQQWAQELQSPEYVQNSGALGALAMIVQANKGRRMQKQADESASQYAERIFAEQQRQEQAQAEAAMRAELEKEQRAYDRQLSLEQEKGRIRNERVPDSVRALEVLSQRPDLAQLDLQRKAAGAARTTVNTGNYQRPFEAALAKNDAEAYGQLRNRAGAAQQALNSIDALDSILSNAQTGKMNEALAMAGQYFGTEAGADFQAANALVQERVVDLMGQLKGPATDQDAERLTAIIPNMGTDPRARAAVFDYLRKKAAQDQQTFQDADTYLRERGNLQGWVPQYGSFSIAPPSGAAAPAAPRGPRQITTQAEFDALPSGATYIDPDDGKTYRKP